MSREPEKTAKDFDPGVLRLYDKFVHGDIDRRGFLEGAGRLAIGAAAASGMLAALVPQFARAQQIAPDDARLISERITFESAQGSGTAHAYLVRPAKSDGLLPVVLVAHENRGLNPHIEDITRRLALAGFIALAPDALGPVGGYPGDEDQARTLFATLDQDKTRADFVAAANHLLKLDGGNGKLGAVGFCYGGGIVNMLATKVPELRAGVPFYGGPAPLDAVAQIKAELLLIFASEDERINASWPAYETALKAENIRYEAVIYPDTQHGFNNDTTPRYDKAAAAKAWERTVEFFRSRLGSDA